MGKRVTITDLARITGFSKTTISHVVNNTPGARIRPETRDMILKSAREHNYVPNFFARNIIRGRTHFLGFLTYSLEEACRTGELIGAEEACRESGCYLMLFNGGGQDQTESKVIEDLVQRGIEGLYASHLQNPREAQDRLSQFDIDLALGQPPQGEFSADCVYDELDRGYHQLCDALRQNGHWSVALVSPDGHEHKGRRESAMRVFREHDLSLQEFMVDSPQSLHALPWFTQRENLPTAIICTYTPLAMSLRASLAIAGLRVPEDVSFVLVDAVRGLAVETLQLTQLQWRAQETSRLAVQRLIKRLYGETECAPPYANEALEPYFHYGATLVQARERVSA